MQIVIIRHWAGWNAMHIAFEMVEKKQRKNNFEIRLWAQMRCSFAYIFQCVFLLSWPSLLMCLTLLTTIDKSWSKRCGLAFLCVFERLCLMQNNDGRAMEKLFRFCRRFFNLTEFETCEPEIRTPDKRRKLVSSSIFAKRAQSERDGEREWNGKSRSEFQASWMNDDIIKNKSTKTENNTQ